MGVLGRGLASLIPKRDRENAEEMIDQIDKMEFEVENTETAAPVAKKVTKSLNVIEDFEQLGDVEGQPMPEKPMVTPLTFDPFESQGGADVAIQRKQEVTTETARIKVEAQEEEEQQEVEVEPETPVVDTPVAESEDEEVAEEEESTLPEEVKEEEVASEPEEVPVVAPTEPAIEEEVEEVVQKEPEAVEQQPEPVVAAQEPVEPEAVMPGFGEDGASASNWDRHEQQVVHIAIGDIKINPLQPRRTFNAEELDDLMRSIEQHGILQPLVVRRLSGDEGYELIAGERRLRASKKLGWDKVPAVVRRDVHSDQSRLVFALIENIQRENLNPVEEALAYKQLNEEYGLTHEEIGQRVGKSRVAITNIVRILQLPTEIQRGLTEGKITTGHAKAILMIPDEDKQVKFYRHLVDEGLTVRKAEVRARRIQRTMNLHDPLRRRNGSKHPLAIKYSPALEERYGYDAQVKFLEEVNRFEVVFKAHSEGEVEELVGRLMGTKELAPKVDEDVTE